MSPLTPRDPRFGELIANGHQFKINDLTLRNAQHFGEGFLIDRWREIEKDRQKERSHCERDRDECVAAPAVGNCRARCENLHGVLEPRIHSVVRPRRSRPWRVDDDQVKMFAEKFGFQTVKHLPAQPYSLLQRYFLAAWPYYFIVVVSPLVCAFATWLSRDRAFALLLFIHASILMVVITALSPQACIRYLQPLSCFDALEHRHLR